MNALYNAAMKNGIALVVILGLWQPAWASDKIDQQAEFSRLQQAAEKANIFALPSFTMKANAQVEVRGKLIDGSYQLLWNGPSHWREEVSFPGYHEIQVGGQGVIWTQRSTDFIPVAIFNLHRALGFGSSAGVPPHTSLVRFDTNPKDVVTKKRHRKEHGISLTCLEVQKDGEYTSELCVRDDTGTLARETSFEAEQDLQPLGTKIFPRRLTFQLESHPLAKVTITELTTGTQFPSDAFVAPAGASPQEGCMNPRAPRITRNESPQYPFGARSLRIQGTVSVQVEIGIDGTPQIRKIVESLNPDLEQSAITAIQKWRYDPAVCEGKPVVTDTLMQVNYKISQ